MASPKPLKNKDGVVYGYQIRVYRGRDADGKQLTSFSTVWRIPEGMKNPRTIKKELEKFQTLYEEKCKAGLVATEHKTFAAYADYVMILKERDNKHSTVVRYKELLVRIKKEIGHLKLEDINSAHLTRFYLKLGEQGQNQRTGGGLSAKTILEHHRLISTILGQAKKENLIRYNPAEGATPPSVRRKEVIPFEIEEVQQIMDALRQEPLKWQCIVRLLIDTGARRGEIMALKWSNIDFKNNRIEIKGNLLYSVDCGIYEDCPKNGKTRSVTIDKEVMDLLARHRKEQTLMRFKMGEHWVNTNYCFTREDGNPMHPDSPTDYLSKFSKKYGLPHIHPHKFRHTQASVLINAGVDIVTVSKRLGHDQVTTTTGFYAHLLAKADEAASTAISKALYKKKDLKEEIS